MKHCCFTPHHISLGLVAVQHYSLKAETVWRDRLNDWDWSGAFWQYEFSGWVKKRHYVPVCKFIFIAKIIQTWQKWPYYSYSVGVMVIISTHYPLLVEKYKSCFLFQLLFESASASDSNSYVFLTFSQEPNLFCLSDKIKVGRKSGWMEDNSHKKWRRTLDGFEKKPDFWR